MDILPALQTEQAAELVPVDAENVPAAHAVQSSALS
jgi:hypothetical protein